MPYMYPNGKRTPPAVSSPYGPRRAPKPGASTFHRGVDFVGFPNILAANDGTVIGAGILPGWTAGGQQVAIDHGNGIVTRYMHMARGSINVKVGQRVSQGQNLGVMGMTGTATGIHLHFEVREHGTAVEPIDWIGRRLAPVVVSKPVPSKPAPVPVAVTLGDDDMPWMVIPSTSDKKYVVAGGKYRHIPSPQVLKLVERVIKMQTTGKPDKFNDVEHNLLIKLTS